MREGVGGGRPLRPGSALSWRRRVAGFAAAVVGLPLLTGLLHGVGHLNLISNVLLFLLAVVIIAVIGGLWPAIVAALGGFVLLTWFFTPPVGTWSIDQRENLLALLVFVAVAGIVSAVVDVAARRTRDAAHAGAEAQTLATIASGVLHGERPLPALLQRVCETFGLRSVTLLELASEAPPHRDGYGQSCWEVAAFAGDAPVSGPAEGDTAIPVSDELVLVLAGRVLAPADRRVLEAFAAHAAIALRQQRLASRAAIVEPLTAADRMRTALLAAVSHDLRTPLASAKAAVGSLRSTEVRFDDEDRAELLATAEESLDRLGRLVANLLDMSRLQAGVLGVSPRPVGLEEAVPAALDHIGEPARPVRLRIPADLPPVAADPGLLERILVNLIGNAIRFSPPDRPALLTAGADRGRVQLRVIDRGPGIPEREWDRVFLPFQRLGDRDNTTGVGLGLALSRGLAEAMNGTLTPEHTPGGGLTMVLCLPRAEGTGT